MLECHSCFLTLYHEMGPWHKSPQLDSCIHPGSPVSSMIINCFLHAAWCDVKVPQVIEQKRVQHRPVEQIVSWTQCGDIRSSASLDVSLKCSGWAMLDAIFVETVLFPHGLYFSIQKDCFHLQSICTALRSPGGYPSATSSGRGCTHPSDPDSSTPPSQQLQLQFWAMKSS